MNGLRVEQMLFPVTAPLVFTAGIQHHIVAVFVGEGAVMAGKRFLRHFLQANSADTRRRPSKVTVHEFRIQPDRFKICAPR